jgi:hypothetical protein
MARRDDSNRMVISVTAFNNLSRRDPVVILTLLAVLALWVMWFIDVMRVRKAASQ